VRINSDIVEDKQCASIHVVSGNDVQSTITAPCFYMPLLMPSPGNPITHNIRDVRATFASSLDFVSMTSDVEKKVLLTSALNTEISNAPTPVYLIDTQNPLNENRTFDKQFIPIAASLKGRFKSVYSNRMIPEGIDANNAGMKKQSTETRMVVVSSSSIISNEIDNRNNSPYPAGYDRVAQQQHGNRDFIVNAVNWLAGNENMTSNRTHKQQMYLLDKTRVIEQRELFSLLNLLFPLLFILSLTGSIYVCRKWKYTKNI